jgi:hypothetical protein
VRGWYVYGQGVVTSPGAQVVPNAGVGIYAFTGAMVADPAFAPPIGPMCSAGADIGGPALPSTVDLCTGLVQIGGTDATMPDVLPLTFGRVYRQGDLRSRLFGIGTSHTYEAFLEGRSRPTLWGELSDELLRMGGPAGGLTTAFLYDGDDIAQEQAAGASTIMLNGTRRGLHGRAPTARRSV